MFWRHVPSGTTFNDTGAFDLPSASLITKGLYESIFGTGEISLTDEMTIDVLDARIKQDDPNTILKTDKQVHRVLNVLFYFWCMPPQNWPSPGSLFSMVAVQCRPHGEGTGLNGSSHFPSRSNYCDCYLQANSTLTFAKINRRMGVLDAKILTGQDAGFFETIIRYYQYFLKSILYFPQATACPRHRTDIVWHTHQLYPAEYKWVLVFSTRIRSLHFLRWWHHTESRLANLSESLWITSPSNTRNGLQRQVTYVSNFFLEIISYQLFYSSNSDVQILEGKWRFSFLLCNSKNYIYPLAFDQDTLKSLEIPVDDSIIFAAFSREHLVQSATESCQSDACKGRDPPCRGGTCLQPNKEKIVGEEEAVAACGHGRTCTLFEGGKNIYLKPVCSEIEQGHMQDERANGNNIGSGQSICWKFFQIRATRKVDRMVQAMRHSHGNSPFDHFCLSFSKRFALFSRVTRLLVRSMFLFSVGQLG